MNPYEDIISKATEYVFFMCKNDYTPTFVEIRGYDYIMQLLKENNIQDIRQGKRVEMQLSERMDLAIKILESAYNRGSEKLLRDDSEDPREDVED